MSGRDDRAPLVVVERAEPRQRPPRYTREWLIAEMQEWARTHDGHAPRYADWNRARARRAGVVFETGWPSTAAVENAFGSWGAGIEAAGLERRGPGVKLNTATNTHCVDCGTRIKPNDRIGERCGRCGSFWACHGERRTPEAIKRHRAQTAGNVARRDAAMRRYEEMIALRREGLLNHEIAERLGTHAGAVANALHSARRRGLQVPPSPYDRGLAQARALARAGRAAAYARRVEEAVRLWRDGATTREIGDALGMTPKSVANLLSRERMRGVVDVPYRDGATRP